MRITNLKITGIIISFSFIINSFGQKQDDFWFVKKDQDYNRLKSIFSGYVDHFPKKDSAISFNNTWSINPSVEYNIKTAFSFNNNLFYLYLNKLKESAIAQYSPNEDCLLVLNRFSTNKNYGYPKKNEIDTNLINLECYKDLYPIPNFSNFTDYQSQESICRLKDDFIIYVLEAKSGCFNKNLTNGKYMPNKWKNGYSKGAAVSEDRKTIIYWTIIW